MAEEQAARELLEQEREELRELDQKVDQVGVYDTIFGRYIWHIIPHCVFSLSLSRTTHNTHT